MIDSTIQKDLTERDNGYLKERMYQLWEDHFADVPRLNPVLIYFGKYSTRQLGSIRWASSRSKIKTLLKKSVDEIPDEDREKKISLINITRHFTDVQIPNVVVDMTIAHEMVHYTHGFHSPLPQLFKHPHKGNVVNKELIKRGLESSLIEAERWIDSEWVRYLRSKRALPARRSRRVRRVRSVRRSPTLIDIIFGDI